MSDTKKGRIKPVDLAMIALFAALTAVLSQIAIPLPFGVPVTLQTFAVSLCGYFLGTKKGTAAIAVYILLGMAGVPVFTGFKGGLVCLFSVTGGFIWSFPALTAACGLRLPKKPLRIPAGIAGLLICHLCGALQYALLMEINYFQSLMLVSVPFLIKDVISVAIAFFLAEAALRLTAKRLNF